MVGKRGENSFPSMELSSQATSPRNRRVVMEKRRLLNNLIRCFRLPMRHLIRHFSIICMCGTKILCFQDYGAPDLDFGAKRKAS